MRNTEKRQAVLQVLDDPQSRCQSDRLIAQQCGVSREYVWRLRQSLTDDRSQVTYRTKHGTPAVMRLSGRRRMPQPASARSVLTGEVLVGAGLSPALAGKLLARLQALPPTQRQQAAALLATLLLG